MFCSDYIHIVGKGNKSCLLGVYGLKIELNEIEIKKNKCNCFSLYFKKIETNVIFRLNLFIFSCSNQETGIETILRKLLIKEQTIS